MQLPINYHSAGWQERRDARDEYVRVQKGLCRHCGQPLTGKSAADIMVRRLRHGLFPKGFFRRPVHLHHDHETGITIGAVHNRCNAVLWQYHGE